MMPSFQRRVHLQNQLNWPNSIRWIEVRLRPFWGWHYAHNLALGCSQPFFTQYFCKSREGRGNTFDDRCMDACDPFSAKRRRTAGPGMKFRDRACMSSKGGLTCLTHVRIYVCNAGARPYAYARTGQPHYNENEQPKYADFSFGKIWLAYFGFSIFVILRVNRRVKTRPGVWVYHVYEYVCKRGQFVHSLCTEPEGSLAMDFTL